MNAAELTYGIEIECGIPYATLQREGWYIGAYHIGAAIPGFSGWKAMRDSSLHMGELTACEVVSPILRGTAGLDSMRAMISKLNEMGAKVNASCGFHVHVGWSGDDAALRRLICLVAHHEKALYAVTGTQNRERSSYCQSIKVSHKPLTELRGSIITQNNTERYHVLNLKNLSTKRTVEFRVFSGTTNATKIAAYIQMCLALVQKATESKRTANWDGPAKKWFRAGEEQAVPAGSWALRQFFAGMGWWNQRRTDAAPMGILEPATIEALTTELKRLAGKYDGITPRIRAQREQAGAVA